MLPENQNLFIKSELNEESFNKLLPFFFEEIHEDFKAIQDAYQNNNIKKIRQLAHKIKGTSISYSAIKISDKAKNIQEDIDQTNTQNLNKSIQSLNHSIDESFAFAKIHFKIDSI